MNSMPDTNNRLKNAVESVPVPADLAAKVRNRLAQEQIEAINAARVKSAVNSAPVPPFLEARIRHRIYSQPAGLRWAFGLASAGAALAIVIGLGVVYQLGHLRLT